MSATTIFTVIAGLLALLAGAVYLFGIPPQMKRAMEEKALDTMGENKASYMLKGMYYCVKLQYPASSNPTIRSDQQNSCFGSTKRKRSPERSRECSGRESPKSSREGGWQCW